MVTKKKKSKQHQTRKKRRSSGGATGLRISALFNNKDELIGIQNNSILAIADYEKVNKINPKYRFKDLLSDAFSFKNVIQNTDGFFHPFDPQPQTMKTRTVKIAINDEDDIQLIQITNQVIEVLNGIKVKPGKLFVVKRYAGKLTKDCVDNFRNLYNNVVLREHEHEILDKFKENPAYEKVVRLMLRTPVLANLICIKFGVLRSGDMKIEEMKEILSYENPDELYDALRELKSAQRKKSKIVGMDQIIEEENKIIMNINNELKNRIEEIKNCKENGICLEDTGNPSNAILGPTSEVPLRQEVFGPSASVLPVNTSMNANVNTPINANVNANTNIPMNAAPLTDENVKDIIDASQRLTSLFTFNEALQISGDKTRETFSLYIKQNYKKQTYDPDFALQNYLIQNLLTVLDIKDTQLFDTSKATKDSYKYQSTVLSLLRILLTWNMRDYNTFKRVFDANFTTNDICTPLEKGVGQLSTFSLFRYNYSYDTIIKDIDNKSVCGDFDAIITIQLNKLYDMLITKGIDYMKKMKEKAFDPNIVLSRYTPYDETYDQGNTNYIF